MITEVGQVRISASNLGEVSNRCQTMNTQAVRFKEDSLFLEPGKKISIFAAEFDVTQALVAQYMAADANLGLVLALDARCRYLEIFFEFGFSCRHRGRHKDNLIIVSRCAKN